jgi:hypothetical protein
MNNKLFISHSSADKRFVRTLKDDLLENGINTWFDEDELNYGDSLIKKLDAAIESTSHFLVILSPNSVDSQWVKYELTKAALLKNQSLINSIIPIKYRECDVPEILSGILYADLSNEVVMQSDNDKVKFTTDGYATFFTRLIKSIRLKDKALSVKSVQEIGLMMEDDREITERKPVPRPRLDIKLQYKGGSTVNLGISPAARPNPGEDYFRADETFHVFELVRKITLTLVNNSDSAAFYPKIHLHSDSLQLSLAPLDSVYPVKAHEHREIECYYSEKEVKLPRDRTDLMNFPTREQKESVNILVEYQDSNQNKYYTHFLSKAETSAFLDKPPTNFQI